MRNLHRKEDYRDTVGKPSRKAHRETVSEGTPIPGAAGGHGHAERGGLPPGSPLWWVASGRLLWNLGVGGCLVSIRGRYGCACE